MKTTQFKQADYHMLFALSQSTDKCILDIELLVRKVCSDCVICHKFIVVFFLASIFNQIVAIDFHESECNLYYLHVTDLFSRLSAAAIIYRTDFQIIYRVLEVDVYMDNGSEFNSQYFCDMA